MPVTYGNYIIIKFVVLFGILFAKLGVIKKTIPGMNDKPVHVK
jgi:hypothetical protein